MIDVEHDCSECGHTTFCMLTNDYWMCKLCYAYLTGDFDES